MEPYSTDHDVMYPGVLIDQLAMSKSGTTHQVFTFNDLRRLALSSRIAASISLAICLGIIITSLCIYFTPLARHHLDRISFRLLFCMMIFECCYDIAWIGLFHDWPTYTPNEVACSIGMFSLFGSLATVNYLCTCIAINLALTVVFNINPRKKHLERWYIAASIVVGYGVILVPAILGHFGKNTSRGGKNSFCWFKQVPDEKDKIVRYYVDFYIWQCLSALLATIFVVMLVYRLWRQGRRGSRLALAGLAIDLNPSGTSTDQSQPRAFYPMNDGESKIQPGEFVDPFATAIPGKEATTSIAMSPSQDPRSPPVHPLASSQIVSLPAGAPVNSASPPLTGYRRFSRAFGSQSKSVTESQVTRVNSLNQLHSKLHGIIIRVSAYPVALVLVNILHTVPDIYLVTHGGIKSRTDWRLYCLFTFLYGGRGIFFALLMILVDPCLRKGTKATWNIRYRNRDSMQSGQSSLESDEPQTPRTSTGVGIDPIIALTSTRTRTKTRVERKVSNNPADVVADEDVDADGTEDDDDDDDIDIFQFFANGPEGLRATTSARNSVATTTTTINTECDPSTKSVRIASIAETEATAVARSPSATCMRLSRSRGRLQRVDEEAEEAKAERWFVQMSSLL